MNINTEFNLYLGRFGREFRSRPVFGRDRIFFLGRDRFLNFWVATGSGRDLRVDGPNH